jgi:DNA repair protein RecO (recombination protein O)
MIEKTRGIILHQIKYSDSGIIAQLYTLNFGRISLLIRGVGKKRSGRRNILFQPMTILDLVIYHKDTGSMPVMKEFSVVYSPVGIYSDLKKSSMVIFLGEVLTSMLTEESPNSELFGFIEDSIMYFDSCTDPYSNFHIAFLAGLSSYLGFEPSFRRKTEDLYFDMLNGVFVSDPPLHGNYADSRISEILARVFASSYETIKEINLTGVLRNEILETLMKYYSVHLPGLKKIRSLEVLKEVFS